MTQTPQKTAPNRHVPAPTGAASVVPRRVHRRTGLTATAALLTAFCFPALSPQPATAQSATSVARQGSDTQDLVQVEILDGGLTGEGRYIGALRLTLRDGWKTYWRSPGEAGIPPRFNWRGSRNVGEMSMTWPTPQVFSTSGYQTIGYHDQLVLPFEITPEKSGRPVRLKGRMELGICKDVCVPSELSFDHQLDAKAGRNTAIVAALASRPYSAREAGVVAATCQLRPSKYGITVEAHITMPSAGGSEIAVIEPGAANLYSGGTQTRRSGQTLIATAELMAAKTGTLPAVERSRLRITVLGSKHAVDITGCTAR